MKEINKKNKNPTKTQTTSEYQIGRTPEEIRTGFKKAQIAYKDRFKGKDEIFTKKLILASNQYQEQKSMKTLTI